MASRDEIAARLRAALTLDFDVLHDGVDMSASAITARLRDACEMSALCQALAELSPAGPERSPAAAPSERT